MPIEELFVPKILSDRENQVGTVEYCIEGQY